MQKRGKRRKFISICLVSLFSFFLLLFAGCRHKAGEIEINKSGDIQPQATNSDFYPVFVKYRAFQNIDSSWGYTIFVNSKPYLHYSAVPFKSKGFITKKDAETVAEILVEMIKKGDMSPKLSKKLTDSLELTMKK